jgi:pimeloyl-ACP methyl ester carboxylesterase
MPDNRTERLNTALEGRYRIERELGTGGMATVYLAEDVKHDSFLRAHPQEDRKMIPMGSTPETASHEGVSRMLRRTVQIGVYVLAAACAAADTSDNAASTQAPVDGYVDVGGVKLHYRDYGGVGDLMVLVHGFFMTPHVYDGLAPNFTDRYHVLAVSRRWHGTSDTTGIDFDLDTLATDLAGFIDHFTDEPAVVVGWATAGLELPRLVRQRPDRIRALVLTNAVWASVPLPEGLPRWPPGEITPDSVYPSVEAAAHHLQPSMNVTSMSTLLDVEAGALHRREDGMYTWLPPLGTRAADRFAAYYDSSAVYDGLAVPVLAIQTENSKATAADLEARGFPRDTIDLALRWVREYEDVSKNKGVEALLAAVPDAEVVALDNVNHNFVIENPDVVAKIIRDFLDRLGR